MLKAVRLNCETYPVEPAEREQLAAAGAQLVEVEGKLEADIIAAAADCDALLVVSSKITEAVVQQLARCRVIARLGAGTDNVAIDAATRSGIVVSNVPDFCLSEQAEHVMALLLSAARRLPHMMDAMRRGRWTARHHPAVHRVAGQTLGLIGFGRSAQAVACRARAFDLHVLAWTRSREKYTQAAADCDVTLVELDDLLQRADFLSVHLPLTPETKHLIDTGKLKLCKPSAILINTSRGAIVDEPALIEALRAGTIGGAALDVFEGIDVFQRPGAPPAHPLYEFDNVWMTPHCAGSSVESTRDSKTRGSHNAAEVLRGYWPPFVVNPTVQPRSPLTSRET